ncbi:MAG: cache domain-containing protein, partial [Pseudomonadota bacterium]
MPSPPQDTEPKRGFSIIWKLTLATCGACLLVAAVLTVKSSLFAADALSQQVQAQLDKRVAAARNAVESVAETLRRDADALSTTSLGTAAFADFQAAWEAGATGNDVRGLYLTGNSNPSDSRARLSDAGDGSVYSAAHGAHHGALRDFLSRTGYSDLYLIDAAGNVLYSVNKLDAFGTNLRSGPHAASPLAEAFGTTASSGEVTLTDFGAYGPQGGAATSFITAPIRDAAGLVVGVAALGTGTGQIDAQIQAAAQTDQTSRVFLVGEDGVLRSDLAATQAVETLTARWTSPLVETALELGRSYGETLGITGQEEAAVSIMPISWGETDWAAVVELDREVFMRPTRDLQLSLMLWAVPLVLGAALLSFLLARSFARPLIAISEAVGSVAEGEEVNVPKIVRNDELGDLARSLDHINRVLRQNTQARRALDCSGVPTMITNERREITYYNESLRSLLGQYTSFMRQIDPEFDPNNLVGRSIDAFHVNPDKQRGMLGSLQSEMRTKIDLDGRPIGLDVNPLIEKDGSKVGFALA